MILTGKGGNNLLAYKVGDHITLIKPDGEEIGAKIGGIEMLSPPNFENLPILVRNLSKEDVPIGKEIFLEK